MNILRFPAERARLPGDPDNGRTTDATNIHELLTWAQREIDTEWRPWRAPEALWRAPILEDLANGREEPR